MGIIRSARHAVAAPLGLVCFLLFVLEVLLSEFAALIGGVDNIPEPKKPWWRWLMAEPTGTLPAVAVAAVSTTAAVTLDQASVAWLGVPVAQALWALAGATLVLAFLAPMKPKQAVGAVLFCAMLGLGAPLIAVKLFPVLIGSERWVAMVCAGGAQVMVPIAISHAGDLWRAALDRLRGGPKTPDQGNG